MKIGVAIPVNGRGPLLFQVLNKLKKQHHKDLEIIAIGQTDSEKRVCKKCKVDFYKYKNEPLGEKWQFGIDKLRERECDAVMIIGSSKFLLNTHIETILQNDYDLDEIGMVGVKDAYLLRIKNRTEFDMYNWPGYSYVNYIKMIGSTLNQHFEPITQKFKESQVVDFDNDNLIIKLNNIQKSRTLDFDTDNLVIKLYNNIKNYNISKNNRSFEPVGSGRIIFKPTLDELDWQIFDTSINESLDWSVTTRIINIGKKIISIPSNEKIKVLSVVIPGWGNKHNFDAEGSTPGIRFYSKEEIDIFLDLYFPETKLIFKRKGDENEDL